MKTSNYLIALAALTSLTLVGCSDNDFLGDGPGGTFAGSSSKGELSFRTSGNNKTTRADITGEDAATKLNNKFTVYGWKYVDASSDAAAEGFEDVFQDYVVKWEGVASKNTSESNTSGWEYVGYQSEPVNPADASYNQTIKYWDWSTDRYDFIAWSIAEGKGQILERNVVANPAKSTTALNSPALKFYAPTASDLGGIYASDKFTSRPENKAKVWADADWTSFFSGGLANVESHPDTKYHRGKYSQLGTNVTADGEEGIVNLQFRNLAAKVRIGIYETIPGYKVSNIVFYKQDVAENTGTEPVATASFTPYLNNWDVDDANHDYKADELFATLYAGADTDTGDDAEANKIFVKRGNVTIKYHDTYYNTDGKEKDNVAYATVDPTEAERYFAFGKLTNERGTTTAIASNPIGETSSTASMSIGNDKEKLYTYVFPMEGNEKVLKLKVNYLLTSIDGSKENIRVTGANAVVPVEFAKWRANYAYTYLFKISDNTNGYTNPSAGPAGLYPITFDACLVNTEDGLQETITTVNDKSITTYQNGSKVTENSEYTKADADADTKTDRIYFTVEGAEGGNALLALDNAGEGQNVWLYTAWAADPSIITEEAVANYKANNIVLTDVTSKLNLTETEAPNESGAKYSIKFTAGTVASFEPVAKYYVIKAAYTDDAGTGTQNYITYKVVKIEDGSDAKAYTITPASANIVNNGSTTFTITNAPAGTLSAAEKALVAGDVTGAKGAIVVKDADEKVVNDLFTITEADDSYTYTIKADAPGGSYTVNMGDASTTITVATPEWATATVNIEEGKTSTNIINSEASGSPMAGITPVVTPQDGAVGKLTASATDTDGQTTLSPAAGSYGTFKVSYHGAEFTVQVNKFTLSTDANTKAFGTDAQYAIINVGDAEHKTASITLSNANSATGALPVATQTIAETAKTTSADVVQIISSVEQSDIKTNSAGVAAITAKAAGTVELGYNNAKMTVEVVNYELTNNGKVDGVRTIKLTKDGVAIDGAVFTATAGTVQSTTTAGVYKVTGTAETTVSFKYKNVVVADITLPAE